MREYTYTLTTTIVGTEDGRETYEIRKTFDIEGKSAILIALYPTVSLLEPISMDSSTMYLLNHIQQLGYNDIRIVNLFSKVFDRKPSLKQLQENPENIEHIEKLLDGAKRDKMDIIIGWCSSMKRNKTSNDIKTQILQMIRDKRLEKSVKELASLDLEQETLCPHMLWMGLYTDSWRAQGVSIDTILKGMGIEKTEKVKDTKKKRGRNKKSKEGIEMVEDKEDAQIP